jgi:ABC-type lipoprotein release transport system permease subunit
LEEGAEIRMALGAQRCQVLWLVTRESAVIVVAGTVSVALAMALARTLSGGVEALDETTRTSVSDLRLLIRGPALLVALALVACYLPARRYARIDPSRPSGRMRMRSRIEHTVSVSSRTADGA